MKLSKEVKTKAPAADRPRGGAGFDTVIWDFNGTLIDDMMLGIRSVNRMLASRSLPEISGLEEYRARFSFPVEEYYRTLGFDFDAEPYTALAREWFDSYLAGESGVTPMRGAAEALELFRRAGLRQIILSASESKLLHYQLNRFGFADYFDRMIGGDDFLAAGKAETARSILGNDNGTCAMIGDTSHDFEVAEAIGAVPFLFSGGHESEERLLRNGAAVSGSLTELAELIISKKL